MKLKEILSMANNDSNTYAAFIVGVNANSDLTPIDIDLAETNDQEWEEIPAPENAPEMLIEAHKNSGVPVSLTDLDLPSWAWFQGETERENGFLKDSCEIIAIYR